MHQVSEAGKKIRQLHSHVGVPGGSAWEHRGHAGGRSKARRGVQALDLTADDRLELFSLP